MPTNYIGSPDFGWSLAFSSDNKNLAVGGYYDNSDIGAAWVYSKYGNGTWDWNDSVKLVPTNSIGSYAEFGTSVAFSSDNKNLAVGGIEDNSDIGAAWVYSKYGNGTWDWNDSVKLVPTNYIGGPDFGYSLAFSSDNKNLAVGGS